MIAKTIKYAYYNQEKQKQESTRHKNKIWFYVRTKNQFNAVEEVYKLMNNAVIVTTATKFHNGLIPPIYEKDVLALDPTEGIKWYKILNFLLKTSLYFPKKFFLYGDIIFSIFNHKSFFEKKLREYNPKAVVFSNDHIPDIRSLLYCCLQQNIKTIYIQHAAVSEFFPKLSFDLSLLEGIISYNKYMGAGTPKGKVKIIGVPRLDKHIKKRKQPAFIDKIGICYSLGDDIKEITEFVKVLSKKHSGKITIRPHPQDNRPCPVLKSNQVVLSNSKTENAFCFLQKQDLIFSGNSTILLESVMMNITSIYCSFFNHDNFDYYNFYKNNMVYLLENIAQLPKILNNPHIPEKSTYLKAKPYNAAIGTEYEDKVSDKFVEAINNFIQGNET
ncbi:MAG: hypothetical protein ACOCUL_00850 [Bacteroidota bacterium]